MQELQELLAFCRQPKLGKKQELKLRVFGLLGQPAGSDPSLAAKIRQLFAFPFPPLPPLGAWRLGVLKAAEPGGAADGGGDGGGGDERGLDESREPDGAQRRPGRR